MPNCIYSLENLINILKNTEEKYTEKDASAIWDCSLKTPEDNLKILEDELSKQIAHEQEIHIKAKQNQHELLRPYQKLGVERIKANSHLLIWEMQTGKTATVCNAMKDFDKVVVLIKKGHHEKWINEFKKFGNREDVLYVSNKIDNDLVRWEVVKKFVKSRDRWVIIINTGLATTSTMTLAGVPEFDYLIIDEWHFLSNTKTQKYKKCKALRNLAKYCCIMTGTLTNKNPNELVYLLKFLYKDFFISVKNFNPFFFMQEWDQFSYEHIRYTHLLPQRKKIWKSFLEKYSSNVLMNEDLKPSIKKIVKILKMHSEHQSLYQKLMEEYVYGEGDNQFQINFVIQLITKAIQMAQSPQLLGIELDKNKEAKWVWSKNYLQQHPQEKVVIFSPSTQYLKLLETRFKELQYKTSTIIGDDNVNRRNMAVKGFQEQDTQILLCNTIAGGKGWTLNKADTIIFTNRDWSAINNAQAEARFNALAQDINPHKKIIDLVLENTIDEHIIKVWNKKITKNEVVQEFAILLKEKRESQKYAESPRIG